MTLADYNDNKVLDWQRNFLYDIVCETQPYHIYSYGYVLPIVKFEEIKDSSQVICEDENTITIQCGRYLTSRVSGSAMLQKIDMDLKEGNLEETDSKITILLSKNGEKTQLHIFQNKKTEEGYVFMKKDSNGTFDDSLDIHATFVGVVSSLKWTVDKKTGLAICNNPLFCSEQCNSEYKDSALKQFLESDEFVKELGIRKKKTTSIHNSFISNEEIMHSLETAGRSNENEYQGLLEFNQSKYDTISANEKSSSSRK